MALPGTPPLADNAHYESKFLRALPAGPRGQCPARPAPGDRMAVGRARGAGDKAAGRGRNPAHTVSRSVFRALTISGQPGGQVRSSDYPAGFSEGLRRCDGADPEGNVMQLPEPLAGAARGPDRVSASPGPLPRGACRKRLNRINSANRAAVGWRRVYCELAGGQYGGARRAGRVLVAAGLASGTGGDR